MVNGLEIALFSLNFPATNPPHANGDTINSREPALRSLNGGSSRNAPAHILNEILLAQAPQRRSPLRGTISIRRSVVFLNW